jgi:hypothetical protein
MMSSLGRCVLIGHLHKNVLDKAVSKQHNMVQSGDAFLSVHPVVDEAYEHDAYDSSGTLMGVLCPFTLCPVLSSSIVQPCSVSAHWLYTNFKNYIQIHNRVCSSLMKGTLYFFNIHIYEQ